MEPEKFAEQIAETLDEANKLIVRRFSDKDFSIDHMVMVIRFTNQDENGNNLAALVAHPGDLTDEQINDLLGEFVE